MILQVISDSWVDIAAPYVVIVLPLVIFIAWGAWSDSSKPYHKKGRKRKHHPGTPGRFSYDD